MNSEYQPTCQNKVKPVHHRVKRGFEVTETLQVLLGPTKFIHWLFLNRKTCLEITTTNWLHEIIVVIRFDTPNNKSDLEKFPHHEFGINCNSFSMNILRRATSLGALLSLSVCGNSHAMEASDLLVYDIGPLTLRPLLELNETFNNNILFRDKDIVGDFVTTVTPGLKLQLGQLGGNLITISYLHDELLYAEADYLNAGQDRVLSGLRYQGGRFSVDGRDQVDFLSTILGGGYSSLSGVLVDRLVLSDRYTVGYQVTEKTKTYLAGNFSMTDWGKNGQSLFDSTTYGGTAGFSLKALSQTSFFGELYYGQTSLEANNARKETLEAEFIGGFLGVRGEFTDKITGSAKIGYETRTFGIEDTGAPVVEMDVSYYLTERSVATLSYQRSQEVSMELPPAVYTMDSANFNYSQKIGSAEKLRAQFNLSYMINSFEPNKPYPLRNDQYFRAGVILSYSYKPWFTTSLGYDFNKFGSDYESLIDYDQNRISLGMKIGF